MEFDKFERLDTFRAFLKGKQYDHHFVVLDPSSFAAEFAGKLGGYPSYEDNLYFHKTFKNDCPISAFIFPDTVIPTLQWVRKVVKTEEAEVHYEESLTVPGNGVKRKVTANRPGTQPWIIKAPVQSEADFDLIDYYAQQIFDNATFYAKKHSDLFKNLKQQGFMPGFVLLTAFEVYYLIDYPDMPLFYYDFSNRYLASIRKVHKANLAVANELIKVGCEMFVMGSAGLELLSPRIFDEAIIPFVRETTDFIHSKGAFTNYHICGHSHQLLKSGRINAMKPTWFETFSNPPCGDNVNLKDSLKYLDNTIISKGNLPLELLRNGTTEDIHNAVKNIIAQSSHRRHVIGQGDATILSGTPIDNIHAYLDAANFR